MKRNILLSLISVPFLIGCGGGSSTTSTTSTATISGTVPGTLIEAFCEDGTYVQVTSTDNNTSEHPFEITVPLNTNCRLVMTTNENDPDNRVITLIGFTNGTATGITFTLNEDINLTHIPLEVSYAEANDTDGDHVVDAPLNIDLNNTSNVNLTDDPVYDSDNNGIVDGYDDPT